MLAARNSALHPRPGQLELNPTQRICKHQKIIFLSVFASGSLTMLNWFRNALHYPIPLSAQRIYMIECIAFATAEGLMEVLQRAVRAGCPWDESTSAAAAGAGHLHVLQWLRTHGCPWDSSAFCAAASGGHLPVIEWAYVNHCKWSNLATAAAARNGHVHVLEWVRTHHLRWDDAVRDMADRLGHNAHFAVMEWAVSNGFELTQRMFVHAASRGCLEVLKHAHKQTFHLYPDVPICNAAARYGHLEVLQWARSQDYRWDGSTCAAAAKGGHLDVLKWLVENGCPWDKRTFDEGSRHGRTTLVRWAVSNGCKSS